jgi:transcriptional regulator with XRE-family HTH domain
MRLTKDGRKRLQKLLLIQEVTHRQLAEAIGWKSHTMVGFLVRGEKNSVSPASACAIAKFLGVEVSDLFLTEMPSVARQASRGQRAS